MGNFTPFPTPDWVNVATWQRHRGYAGDWLYFLARYVADEHFMLWLADYMFYEANEQLILDAERVATRPEIGCVRLSRQFTPQHFARWEQDGRFRVIPPGAAYSFSQQITIWKTNVFRRILKDGEDPWQTEIYGSSRMGQLYQGRPGEPTFLGLADEEAIRYHNLYKDRKIQQSQREKVEAIIAEKEAAYARVPAS